MDSNPALGRLVYGYPQLSGQATAIREPGLAWTLVSDDEYGGIISTGDEIRRAVERNAKHRGILFVEIIVQLNIDYLLSKIDHLAENNDKEELWERSAALKIDREALTVLDASDPPIPYTNFFCLPETLIEQPDLEFYYRNIALLSDKVMKGIGLHISASEAKRGLSHDRALEIASYLNGVVSGLIIATGATRHRHVEMLMANLGDSLGGSSRNEVGRVAVAVALRPVIVRLWERNLLDSVTFSTRADLVPGSTREQQSTVPIGPGTNIEEMLDRIEAQYVKYQRFSLRNGTSLLVDKSINWQTESGEIQSASSDLHSLKEQIPGSEALWAAEVKGGADPAGSDEHWKTASRALSRIIETAERAGFAAPPLSFIGTTIVAKVADEIAQWIDRGDLVSAYNLTKIIEDEDHRRKFVDDMLLFLGVGSDD